MHCVHCNYSLWNLSTRVCPECGEPFALRDYHFQPRSVTYTCPECERAVNGPEKPTDFDGREMRCSVCRLLIPTATLALQPAAGCGRLVERGQGNPWVTAGTGLGQRWWDAATLVWSRPAQLFIGIKKRAATTAAVTFAVLTVALLVGSGAFMTSVLASGFRAFTRVPEFVAVVVTTATAVVATLAVTALWAVLAHPVLLVTGGARPFGHTLQAMCYSTAALAPVLVPFIGPLGAIVTWPTAAVILLAAAHQVHDLRALVAILWLPVSAVATGLMLWAYS